MAADPAVSHQGQEPSLKVEVRRWVDRLEVAMFPHQESEEEQESFTDVGRKRVSGVIQEILEEASAEHTRAILRYTAKGYAAGENTDAKHWRKRAEDAEAALASASASPHPDTFSENETKDVLTALYQDGHVDLVLADRVAALMASSSLGTPQEPDFTMSCSVCGEPVILDSADADVRHKGRCAALSASPQAKGEDWQPTVGERVIYIRSLSDGTRREPATVTRVSGRHITIHVDSYNRKLTTSPYYLEPPSARPASLDETQQPQEQKP